MALTFAVGVCATRLAATLVAQLVLCGCSPPAFAFFAVGPSSRLVSFPLLFIDYKVSTNLTFKEL